MKRLILILAALPAFSQNGVQYQYVATTGQVSLSSAATAATLQQPTTGANPVSFPAVPGIGASVYCSVACTATVSTATSGTGAATATAGTVNPSSPTFAPAATVLFYTASNASNETTKVVFNVSAGQTFPIDMSALKLGTGQGATRVTITTSAITGTANITFYPVETH